jgi:sigma-B regulation protein RsbU (phosphoserine phosphatase)
MGFVLLGNKMNQATYSLSEIQTLMTIFNMNTPFLLNLYMLDSLKEKNIELANHLQILRTILETTKNLDSVFNKDKVIQLFLLTLMGRLTVSRYLWLICDDVHESGNYEILAKKRIDFSREQILRIVYALKREHEIHSEPILLKELVPDLTGENMLVVPYVKESGLKSILLLGAKLSHVNWSFLEMDFASILLSQVLHILENLELLDEKIQKEILEKELNVARSIQNQLLPSSLPGIPNLEIMFYNQPSRQVGGDYCDVILRENYLYITIADVSGKSVPAALIMSHVQSALRILTEFNLTLTDMVFRLNNQLCENTATDKFVTLFLGRLNLDTYELEYINAGHNPPYFIHCKNKSVQVLEKGGLLLGMIKNVAYEKGTITLSPDTLLFLYTDGVTETLNPKEEEWGEENLKQFLIRHSHLPAEKMKEDLLKTLAAFSGPKENTDDDITFVYLKRLHSN